MFIEFSTGNFLSFDSIVTFSMVAAKLTAKDKNLDRNNVFRISEEPTLLKSAAIYGANASGKSNLIKAISFMREFVLNSSKNTQSGELIDIEGFRLSHDSASSPSFFELVFILEGKKYRYGFEANHEKVVSEWLFYVPTTKEAKLFSRDSNGIFCAAAFKEGKGIIEKTRDNALFLSVSAQFNGPVARGILGYFKNLRIILGLFDLSIREFTVNKFEDDEDKLNITQLVKNFDLGIDDIQIEKVKATEAMPTKGLSKELNEVILKTFPTQIMVRTHHKKYNSDGQVVSTETFDLDDNESAGTRRLFSLAGPLIEALKKGDILIIDELDARLHPLITSAIIRLFNSNESNPRNAQLIFTNHDTNLLTNTIFRRDQIWFTEKNRIGATDLYSPAEFKVRNDASYEKDYIQGRYGAIPFIGDIRHLIPDRNGQ